MTTTSTDKIKFTSYQIFMIVILVLLQFTIILDFMVLSPLGAHLMKVMEITPSAFGLVVSAYAFSAGISGFLTAGFADKFDRKKMLVFFYTGFIIGTIFCALAPTYHFLLAARIFTGIFGGVISSISFAIITDTFPMERRGTVMGFVQMAFAASQILGIPLGLFLANKFNWHAPFVMVAAVAMVVLLLIIKGLNPINEHLKLKNESNPILHLWNTFKNINYLRAFLTTSLLATGGFMLMPFSSAFLVNNVHISAEELPFVFMITGVFSIITGPLIGRLSDKIGKYNTFVGGTILSMLMVYFYTHLGPSTVQKVIFINAILFAGITSRMIAASALMTAVPEPKDRGAFMGVNSSIQQLAGGLASVISGLIVVQVGKEQPLQQYDTVGYLVIISMILCAALMFMINRYVQQKNNKSVSVA